MAAARGRKKAAGNDDADKALDKKQEMKRLLDEINCEFGKGTMRKLTDQPLDVPKFSTGLLSLDIILGGGIPKGRIIEVFGPEATGKTTLAMQILAEMQKPDNIVQFLDVENSFNPEYAIDLGLDPDRLLMTNPSSGGEAFDIMLKVIRNRVVSGICVDSVAALTPLEEQTASIEDSQMALQARMMTKGLRNITQSNVRASESDCCTVIFINQTRVKIGVLPYQNPEERPGGKALRFYSSIVLELRRGKPILNSEGEKIGHKLIVKNPKNKISVPHKEVVLDLMYSKGLCRTSSLLEAATMLDVVELRGSYYSFEGERLAQGRTNVIDHLKEDPELAEKVTAATRAAFQKAIEEKRANMLQASMQEGDATTEEELNEDSDADEIPADLGMMPIGSEDMSREGYLKMDEGRKSA